MHRRLTFSGLTVGSGISTRSPDIITRNNSANSGGFIAQFCGTFPDNSTNGTGFMGLANLASNTYMPTMAGLTTVFGIGFDRNDSNYSIVYNDGSGNANKLDLGTNFPINITTTPWLELTLYCPPNSNYIAYMVTNRGNNKIATGSINSDIPSTSAMLKHYMGASPTVSGSVSYEFGGFKNASFY